MNFITFLVLLALPALAVSGYFLRTVARSRTVELLGAAAGISTIPLLRFGVGTVPDLLLTMVPLLFAASTIAGCQLRDRFRAAVESPNKLETAATIVLLTLCSMFCFTLGMFFFAHVSMSIDPMVVLVAGAMFTIAATVGFRSTLSLALSRN